MGLKIGQSVKINDIGKKELSKRKIVMHLYFARVKSMRPKIDCSVLLAMGKLGKGSGLVLFNPLGVYVIN